jgi:hypothetical protein
VDDPAVLAEQIPLATTLATGTRVALPPIAWRRRGALGRILGPGKVAVGRAARCTALIVRGYVDIGADDGSAWGFAR